MVELFAGVGGFRLGLEGSRSNRKAHHKNFETIWFNQWEPSTRRQHAHETYVKNFGYVDEFTNTDIAQVVNKVPDHDLLVGGFPCQDYSVARNLSSAAGLEGKKGVLWWSIYNILKLKGKKAPDYLMLENVDRLLNSPATRRGRDFAIILSSLNQLGYVVEWRVINAADYSFPQRRRRTFILGYKKGSNIELKYRAISDPHIWISQKGVVHKAFAAKYSPVQNFEIPTDPVEASTRFNTERPKLSPFNSAGMAVDHRVFTAKATADYSGSVINLGDILIPEDQVTPEYRISTKDLERWQYLKGAKAEPRKGTNGFEFLYKEGAMSFPDPLDKPSRTIITGEGGPTPSRFKHVISTKKGYRRLVPIELERLCMFPDNHTAGHPDSRRAFFMGNALVVGVIDGLGRSLSKMHYSV